MVIAEADGMMTITASDDQIAFVVFGACTPQQEVYWPYPGVFQIFWGHLFALTDEHVY